MQQSRRDAASGWARVGKLARARSGRSTPGVGYDAPTEELRQVRGQGLKHPGERLTSPELSKVNDFEPPRLGFPDSLGPGSLAPPHVVRPLTADSFPSIIPGSFKAVHFIAKKKKKGKGGNTSLPPLASSHQAAPALAASLLTRSGSRTAGGWSRSSRLPPSCVSPSHLAGLKHAGKLGGREGRGGIPAACAHARACAA